MTARNIPSHRLPSFLALTNPDEAVEVALPASHFLSHRPPTAPSPPSVIAQRYWSSRARPDTSSLAAADYDVSVETGFLPPQEPVQKLEVGGGWEEMEVCLEDAQREVQGLQDGGVGGISDEWRTMVLQLEQPSIEVLTTLPLLRRAHILLSFIGHFYIHSTFPALSTLPPAVAVPWVEVSDRLGIPPILTYADTVLWNWKLLDRSGGVTADNIEITTTFTSSPSERAFFLLSLLCELHAPNLLRLMSATMDEAFFADSLALPRIASYLEQISLIVNELTQLILQAVKGPFGVDGSAHIVPATFYWDIRPWFNGGKFIYEGVDPEGEGGGNKEMEWGGPSAGQSSLVHALDLFLSVDHSPRAPSDSSAASNSKLSTSKSSTPSIPENKSSTVSMDVNNPLPPPLSKDTARDKMLEAPNTDSTFMIRASQYMPSHHRSFLNHLSRLHIPSVSNPSPIPSVRELAVRHSEVEEAYDQAVGSMKRFRDAHMKLVTVFIIAVAKKEPSKDSIFWDEWNQKRLERIEVRAELERQKEVEEGEKLVGTGGTELVSFLKTCRERTVEAYVGTASRSRSGSYISRSSRSGSLVG